MRIGLDGIEKSLDTTRGFQITLERRV